MWFSSTFRCGGGVSKTAERRDVSGHVVRGEKNHEKDMGIRLRNLDENECHPHLRGRKYCMILMQKLDAVPTDVL